MRVKEPSTVVAEKAKRSRRPPVPHDEDSSDDITVGFTCQHVTHAVNVNHVKKAIAENLWSVCSECLKERRFYDGQPVLSSDIWLCLKCGFQGCGKNSESQHSLKHFKSWRTELHCIIISLSTWIIWCYECDEKLSTHCNKKVLVQIVDFLQKHVSKTQTSTFSKIIKLCEEKCETGEKKKGRKGSCVTSVKGIMNLGNTCFFNAVMQNLAQSYILTELMSEIKENGTKLKIFPSSDSQLRIQAGILKAFNNPTTKTADDETRKQVKAYGREGVKMNLIDRIFIGELTSTVMCEECANVSTVKDPFIDISLPIIEERHQLIHGRKRTRKLPSGEDKAVVVYRKKGNSEVNGDSSVLVSIMNTGSPLTENPTEGSAKEASHSESSVDADSEASESESASRKTLLPRSSSGCCGHHRPQQTNGHHRPSASETPPKETDSGDEGVADAISELRLSSTVTGDRDSDEENQPLNLANNLYFSEGRHMMSPSPENAFQTLSQSYVTTSKECSVQSCLYQFTSMELLMGNNKLLCENCTEKKQKCQRETSSTEKKAEGIYTNARKQLLISAVPVILILHLKRFHQAGLGLRKVNRHVDFPLVLDLAPFCSATCKNVHMGEEVLYGLYGIVEHSGSMRGGHYTAYVKVRTPSRKLWECITGKKSVPGLKEPDSELAGQWVHVSDTYVQVVPESRALSAQAYLLFYERMF
ncbi:ubiquitin carboxyl-terminal hydrolase 45 isoform X4 [Sturnira hondurensis]|uniref:ubiquitin carboxyl-terminal hydrolase 45 isoform X4 n=1 Tax=Sturnira hondurensis TaxID=192404 RepID=UPI00187983DC|nr:ubiquitin carboxyl-terminal hydrolase 45 isoform X4 [Sturnira hondurensis]